LAEYERVLDEAAAADARAAAARVRLAELEDVRWQREAEVETRSRELAAASAGHDALEREWMAWSTAAGFGINTLPELVLERVAALEAAQGALAAFETAAREVCAAESTIAVWEARARAAVTPQHPWAEEQPSGIALIERVLAVQVQREAPEQIRREELRACAARVAAAEAEVAHCREHVASLLRASGATDEADLTRRRAAAQQRRALLRAIAEDDAAIRDRLGGAVGMDVLESGAVESWQQAAAVADHDIRVLEEHRDRLVDDEGQARTARRELEESPEVAALESEWAALMAELGDAVHGWRELAAASGLIEVAWETFERTQQSPVLRAASQTFATVTAGRYERIVQDAEGEALLVREGGRWKQVDELSRSTREQLYLSIRLGLARELAQRGVALPLMLDDVLVNFDSERARRMAAVLATVAREQQVLFVTCHAELRDLLVQFGLAARVIELPSG
jgi:uncharacterized protein YhaN